MWVYMLTVLRLGHRIHRDFRITTHCGLVARAFGATKMWITGDYDKKLISNLREVVFRFGGPFDVDYVKDWKNLIKCLQVNFVKIKIHHVIL